MIRHAEPRDRLACIGMMREFHAEYARDLFPAAGVYGESLFREFTSGGDRLALVHDVDGTARGLLLARAGDYDLGPVRIANERLWWVAPAFRGNARVAVGMLQAFEQWARDRGCKLVSMSGLVDNVRVSSLYRRMGYAAADTTFLKVI